MGILREVQGARPENGRSAPVVREFIVYSDQSMVMAVACEGWDRVYSGVDSDSLPTSYFAGA